MDFIALFNLWQSAQAKVATLPGNATVTVNTTESTIEFKIGANVINSTTDLTEIHIALDAAIAINGIINP